MRAEVGTAVSATVVVEVGVVVGEGDMGRIDAPAGDSKCFVKAAAATAVRELGGSIILVEIRVGEIVEDLVDPPFVGTTTALELLLWIARSIPARHLHKPTIVRVLRRGLCRHLVRNLREVSFGIQVSGTVVNSLLPQTSPKSTSAHLHATVASPSHLP